MIKTRLAVALIFALGLTFRVVLLPLTGTTDHEIFKCWSVICATNSPTSIYTTNAKNEELSLLTFIPKILANELRPVPQTVRSSKVCVDYPPVLPWMLGGILSVANRFTDVTHAERILNALVKIPDLVFSCLLLLGIYCLSLKRAGQRVALVAAGFFFLNPLIIIEGPLLAYQDTAYLCPLIFGLWALSARRYTLGWTLYAFSLLIKPQPLVLGPVILFYTLMTAPNRAAVLRSLGAGCTVVGMCLMPFVIAGTLPALAANYAINLTEPCLSAQCFNTWWLAGYIGSVLKAVVHHRALADALFVSPHIVDLASSSLGLPVSIRTLSIFLFGLTITGTLLRWWQKCRNCSMNAWGDSLFEISALVSYAATMVLTQAHENHQVGPAFILLASWWYNPRYVSLTRNLFYRSLALSMISLANICFFYGLGPDLNSIIHGELPKFGSVIGSLLNVFFFASWLFDWFFRGERLASRTPVVLDLAEFAEPVLLPPPVVPSVAG